MAKLTTIPVEMIGKTNDELMEMSEQEINAIVDKYNLHAEMAALCALTTKKKVYPKVLKPGKKNPDKMTWQADKTQKPSYVVSPIGFFEVKAKFIHDICGVPRVKKEKKETFRDRFIAAAKAAEVVAAAAPKKAADEKKIDAQMAEIFGKK